MDNNHQIKVIESKIVTVRGQLVMLDEDLAKIYEVKTLRLNEQVKRNPKRFPQRYCFQLTNQEWDCLKSQSAISNNARGGRRTRPFVFTEHGCLQASNVLKSDVATEMSVLIIDTFVAMKNQMVSNPNYDLLKEQILRLQAETKLFNAKADTIRADMVALKADHIIDLNVQNMEINDLNEKVTELLNEFNKFRDASIIIKKDEGIGRG
jgi:hypothetical protein